MQTNFYSETSFCHRSNAPKVTRYKILENNSFEITRLLLHISVNSKCYQNFFLHLKEYFLKISFNIILTY